MSGPPQPKTFREKRPPKRLRAKPKTSSRARPDEPMADYCEICGDPRPDQRHHKLRRSQGGSDDRSNTLDLCGGCHREVHANPAYSYEMGYLVRRSA